MDGWLAGFVLWCGLCPWIQFVLEVHGGMGKWGGWGTFVLFGLYKGLYLAVFCALAGLLLKRWWSIPAIAALWTGLERLHTYSGFSWLHLGNAAINMSWPMRLAPVLGVFGISFAFALVSAALAAVFFRRPTRELFWLVLLPLVFVFPSEPVLTAPRENALVVQPNIDTEAQWTEAFLASTEQKLAALSHQNRPGLIIWPEVPAPFYDSNAAFHAYAAKIAQASKAHFLFGAVAFNPDNQPLNSAVMMDPNGREIDRYDKINLVPFGEFIPPPFGFVNRITHEAGDFAAGRRIVVFPVDGHSVGAFICYESVFPDLVRQFTLHGAEVLVNLSNDGYFGNSQAHQQHLEIARMRAAENRRWILRATNDGITASIDPHGHIANRIAPFQQSAALMPFDYEREMTFYTRHGDWFAWSCLAGSLLLAGFSFFKKKPGTVHSNPDFLGCIATITLGRLLIILSTLLPTVVLA